jgi:hypothetical protein
VGFGGFCIFLNSSFNKSYGKSLAVPLNKIMRERSHVLFCREFRLQWSLEWAGSYNGKLKSGATMVRQAIENKAYVLSQAGNVIF